MKAEQLKELLQDEDFANKLKTLHTPEEIMAAFQEKELM